MILPPISVILSWPAANRVNPAYDGQSLLPVLSTFMVASIVVVGLRLYSRACLLHAFSWDDWIIIPATISAMIMSISTLLTVKYGFGYHIWDVDYHLFGDARLWAFVAQFTFTCAVALTKISILLFYTRFCKTRRTQWAIRATLAFICVWFIAWTIVIFIQCIPLEAYWRFPRPGDRCLPAEDEMHIIHGSTNVATDWVIWAIPIPTVIRLRLPIRQKLSLLFLFSLGLIAPIAGVVRIVYIHKALGSWDVTWYGIPMWILTSAEAHISIICASAPSLKPLIVKAFPRFGTSHTSSKQSGIEGPITMGGSRRDYISGIRNSIHGGPESGQLGRKDSKAIYFLTDFGCSSDIPPIDEGTSDIERYITSEIPRAKLRNGSDSSVETFIIQRQKEDVHEMA